MLENALLYSFPQAEVFIDSDLLAASRALFGTGKGIACILGTGSNSCFYNGKEIKKNVSPLGFILGDEGSGAVLGRKFISDCLKNQLPVSLQKKFFSQYDVSPSEIMDRVYKQPFPNRYLASLSPFLLENIGEESIYRIVEGSFTEFFERNIKQYAITGEGLGFVGSVAYYFQDILREVAEEMGYRIDFRIFTE
jgi:N-acetylglucosamine kinase-like BadF-type ATPase